MNQVTSSSEKYIPSNLTEQARHLIDSYRWSAPNFDHHDVSLKLLGFEGKVAADQTLSEAEQEVVDLIKDGLSRSVDIPVSVNTWSGSLLIVEMTKADYLNPTPQDCLYFVRVMEGDDEGEVWLTNPYTKDFRGYELEHFIFSADRGLIEYAATEDLRRQTERYQQKTIGYHFTDDQNKRLQAYLFEQCDPDYPY